MTRIDLNSQEPGIQQQDFMERPLPTSDAEKFDVLSLSLVLNFVPNAADRGRMLLRTLAFLRSPDVSPGPSLFLVLPRSCLENSRYLTESRFDELMSLAGFNKLESKMTQKLAYSLWKMAEGSQGATATFGKKEVNPGRVRNNFVITLQDVADRHT